MNKINLGIVGASGLVGSKLSLVMEQLNLPIDQLILFGKSTIGSVIKFAGRKLEVKKIDDANFKDLDYVIFSAGSEVASKFCKKAVSDGAFVIDMSSHFRYDENVPLIIPEINGDELSNIDKPVIIANPNCSTAQLLMVLKPIHDMCKISSVDVATYQAVSGTGKAATQELYNQIYIKDGYEDQNIYPKQIAFNVIPQCDVFLENDFTKEEMKMIWETHKILDNKIEMNVTCTRVPVFNGHSEAVFIRTEKFVKKNDLVNILESFNGVTVVDDSDNFERDAIKPIILSESLHDDNSGFVHTIASSAKYIACLAPDSIPAGLSQTI